MILKCQHSHHDDLNVKFLFTQFCGVFWFIWLVRLTTKRQVLLVAYIIQFVQNIRILRIFLWKSMVFIE